MVKVTGRPAVARMVEPGKPRRLLSGALLALGGYLALAALAAGPEPLALDHEARAWVALVRVQALQTPMETVTLLGDHVGLVPLIVIAMAALWTARRRWALALPALMAGTWAVQALAKTLADRPRPDLAPWGFPSGHVLSVVVFSGLVVYLVASASGCRRGRRALAGGVASVTVLIVGFSRLYLDKHWLSDLAGGLTIGVAYLLLGIWVVDVVLSAGRERSAAEVAGLDFEEGREPAA